MTKIYLLQGYTDPQMGGGGAEVLIITKHKQMAEKYEQAYEYIVNQALKDKGKWPEKNYDFLDIEEHDLDQVPMWLQELYNYAKETILSEHKK